MDVHDNTDEYSNETEVTPLLCAPLDAFKWGQLTGGTKSNIHWFISDIYIVKDLMLILTPHHSFTLYFESVIYLLVEVTIEY